MPLPVRSLPVLQNWDCHSCGNCCRTYFVRVTAAEKATIDAQAWEADLGLPAIVWDRALTEHRLNRRDDGACVFLGGDNLCKIHAKFGAAAKPMACRVYPFTVAGAGDHLRVGVRFACPSVTANDGTPLANQRDAIREAAALVVADEPTRETAPPPPLKDGESLNWRNLLKLVDVLAALIGNPAIPVERKLRQVLAVATLCRRLSVTNLSDPQFAEFLQIVAVAEAEAVPDQPAQLPRPGFAGRVVFRQIMALYTRKDIGQDAGDMIARGAVGRALGAARFARGTGRVPRIHGAIPPTATFADGEAPAGPLPPASEVLLARYYRIKLESLQFCGLSNFQLDVWDGLESLILTFPAILWLAKLIAAGGRPLEDAVAMAVQVVDDNFGYNPLLGSAKQKWALRMIALRGDLPRLVAWYGR